MYYKVYANCVRRPKGLEVINISNDYTNELLIAIKQIFDHKFECGELDSKIIMDDFGDIEDDSIDAAYEDVRVECISKMEEEGYICVGDYMIVDSEKSDIKRPDMIGRWG